MMVKTRTHKIIMKNDYFKISLIRRCSSNGEFIEYNLEGKLKAENTGKWFQDFIARALVDDETGIVGYIVVEQFLDPYDGKSYKPSSGYIAHSAKEFVDRMPRMKQEYLDKLEAALLQEIMLMN